MFVDLCVLIPGLIQGVKNVDMELINTRQATDYVRDALLQYHIVSFGQFQKSPRHLYEFRIWFFMYSAWYWPRHNMRGSHYATDDQMVEFDKSVVKYFTDRIGEIRAQMRLAGVYFDSCAWDKILTPSFFGWIFNAGNPFRKLGDLVAHESIVKQVLMSLDTLMSVIPQPGPMKDNLVYVRSVYEESVQAIGNPPDNPPITL